jgi:hypothetical protein
MVAPKLGAQLPDKDTSQWLTRSQVMDLLCVSDGAIRQWEAKGLLHPVLRIGGKHVREVKVYDPLELANLPQYKRRMAERSHAIDPGELTARAFELFADSKTIEDVVIELRITMGVAESLRQDWLDARKQRGLAELEKADES